MTWDEITAMLKRDRNLDVLSALEKAALNEAMEIFKLRPTRDGGAWVKEKARTLFAEDITWHVENVVALLPHRIIDHHRFAICWAVASYLKKVTP